MRAADVAVLALHYQNDVLHPEGKIRVGLDGDGGTRQRLLRGASDLLRGARMGGLPIVHVRIAFRPDYADLLANCDIFRNVAAIGAVPEGQWGSAFYEGLQPLAGSAREFVVKHTRISAFYGTPLEETLRVLGARRLVVAGVATHSVVEGTVRHAADIGFNDGGRGRLRLGRPGGARCVAGQHAADRADRLGGRGHALGGRALNKDMSWISRAFPAWPARPPSSPAARRAWARTSRAGWRGRRQCGAGRPQCPCRPGAGR